MNNSRAALRIARWQLLFTRAITATMFSLGAAEAKSSYCVRPVPVVAASDAADLARKLDSQEPLPKTPNIFSLANGARYPLAYHPHTVGRLDGGKYNHDLYWSFSENYELVGPRNMLGASPPAAVGRSGRSLLLGGSYQLVDSHRLQSRHSLLEQDEKGAIAEVDPSLQTRLGDPFFVTWSTVLDGFVLSATKWRLQHASEQGRRPTVFAPPDMVGNSTTYLLQGGALVELPAEDMRLSVVTDLPGLGVTALLDGRSLTILTPQHAATKVADLDRGRFGGFNAIHETRDKGWLYVVGDDYENAVHVEQADGRWRATAIVQIVEDSPPSDVWDRVIRWLFGIHSREQPRDKVSTIRRASSCGRYSTAARRMFFCGQNAFTYEVTEELRAGKIAPLPGGLKTFLGDADSLGLALFIDAGHRLSGYDGEQVHTIAKADFKTAMVYDVAKLGRSFLVSSSTLFEVRADDGKYRLVKLADIDERGPVPVYAAPDGADVLVFGRTGVYQVGDGALVQIWSGADRGTIEPYGNTPPTDVAGWGGLLFTTHKGHEIGFHLLQPCPDPTADTQKR
ncbi:hypothetical protein [Bradyrhizobium roseum]|uniref:hypothetical protein n=1 Tax=Bradyrhizobium roseum TaxID=3056648 RepID=UPI002601BCC5|nr:hypothetical protein [Bradyrhizobium roseus]WKA28499.1 hypothetical protein QUH67_34080 [Bradyrhizobium roseus]